ncbi:MAG: peptidoglycan DD-metalloendopeptidase family protein [Planctomycetes bacterium]|nr:peptidoglycan DD-metalloendopeptidase family protein [Planctomycetota bacterium]
MKRAIAAVLALCAVAPVAAEEPVEAAGRVKYLKDGIEIAGRKTTWGRLGSLEETEPDVAALQAEFAARAQKRPDEIADHLALGRWARENGLLDEAKKEFEAAMALQADNPEARKALGWVKVAAEWKPVAEVFEEKCKALKPDAKAAKLDLAKWCGDNGYADGEWHMLVELAIADPWDKGMIARARPFVDKRRPETALHPALAGRWRAEVDSTGHHQIKVFAIYAIDFRRVDAAGKTCKGTGKSNEDFYGWDNEILACADGTVTIADDHWDDLPAGVAGKFDQANFVVVQHTTGESTAYGHIKKGSALFKVGDTVKAGQPIARVGNSGASGYPHLHFTLQTPIWNDARAGGWISIPWRFDNFRVVEANGAACGFEVKRARVQEGWVMEFPGNK